MKRQRTKEQAQLISKINAYIIPVFGLVFLYLAIDKRDDTAEFGMLLLIGVFLLGYGIFRVYLIQKLTKDMEDISDDELTMLQKAEDEDKE